MPSRVFRHVSFHCNYYTDSRLLGILSGLFSVKMFCPSFSGIYFIHFLELELSLVLYIQYFLIMQLDEFSGSSEPIPII